MVLKETTPTRVEILYNIYKLYIRTDSSPCGLTAEI